MRGASGRSRAGRPTARAHAEVAQGGVHRAVVAVLRPLDGVAQGFEVGRHGATVSTLVHKHVDTEPMNHLPRPSVSAGDPTPAPRSSCTAAAAPGPSRRSSRTSHPPSTSSPPHTPGGTAPRARTGSTPSRPWQPRTSSSSSTAGEQDVVVVGSSIGGWIALEMALQAAARRPVRRGRRCCGRHRRGGCGGRGRTDRRLLRPRCPRAGRGRLARSRARVPGPGVRHRGTAGGAAVERADHGGDRRPVDERPEPARSTRGRTGADARGVRRERPGRDAGVRSCGRSRPCRVRCSPRSRRPGTCLTSRPPTRRGR